MGGTLQGTRLAGSHDSSFLTHVPKKSVEQLQMSKKETELAELFPHRGNLNLWFKTKTNQSENNLMFQMKTVTNV